MPEASPTPSMPTIMQRRLHRLFWFALLTLVLTPRPAGAQGLNPLPVNTIDQLVDLILRAVITIGVPVLVFFFLLTGFYFVTAMGEKAKIKQAHDMLWNTIVGAALVLGAKVIHEVLVGTLTQLKI